MGDYKFAFCFPIKMGLETAWSGETEENLLTRRFAVGGATTDETHHDVKHFVATAQPGDFLCVGTGVIIRQRVL